MRETVAVDMEAGLADLEALSRELASVAARIQSAIEEQRIGNLDDVVTAEVEVAERALDTRARDLRAGLGDRYDWSCALEAYEQVWLRAIRSCGVASSLAA